MGLNRDDWLKIVAGAGLLGTGAGLAGVGPLAGLLGEMGTGLAAGAKGAALAPGLAGPTTAGASGAMGAGAMLGKGVGVMADMAPMAGMMQAGQGQPMPPPPPPPQGAPVQQGPQFQGYQGMPGGSPNGLAFLDPEMKRRMMEEMRKRGMGGVYG